LVERAQRDLVAFEIKDDGLAECLTGGVSHHWRRENPSPTSSVGLSAGRRALLISA
jgi:hypothetical protein